MNFDQSIAFKCHSSSDAVLREPCLVKGSGEIFDEVQRRIGLDCLD